MKTEIIFVVDTQDGHEFTVQVFSDEGGGYRNYTLNLARDGDHVLQDTGFYGPIDTLRRALTAIENFTEDEIDDES